MLIQNVELQVMQEMLVEAQMERYICQRLNMEFL
jgi:hypothetical protein